MKIKKGYALVLLVIVLKSQLLVAQVTILNSIITDYNGGTFSKVNTNAASALEGPAMDINGGLLSEITGTQNLLAFQISNNRYFTTGVNNTIVQGILPTYSDCSSTQLSNCIDRRQFRAFPSQFLGLLNTSAAADAYKNLIGVPTDYPTANVINNYRFYLDDGTKGLDVSTAVFNIDLADGLVTFDNVMIDPTTINDGIPDIVVTQTGQPSRVSTELDWYFFSDDTPCLPASNYQNCRIGTGYSVAFSTVNTVSRTNYKFFRADNSGGTPPSVTLGSPTYRSLRMLAVDWSDLGITSSNYDNIRKFNQKFNGASDIAFIAYNEESLKFIRTISGNVQVADLDGVTRTPIPTSYGLHVYLYEVKEDNSEVLIADTVTDVNGNYIFGERTQGALMSSYPTANKNYKVVVGVNQLIIPSPINPSVNRPYRVVENVDNTLNDYVTVHLEYDNIIGQNFVIGNFCLKEPSTDPGGEESKFGISTLNTQSSLWPKNVKNAFMVLESKSKGFVITRVPSTNMIQNPVEGMVVYDIQDHCVKLYNVNADPSLSSWDCIERDCNED